jgi:hypothetical protein
LVTVGWSWLGSCAADGSGSDSGSSFVELLCGISESAAEDIPGHKHFPEEHRQQLHSTNPLERHNKEIKRRCTDQSQDAPEIDAAW